MTNLVLPFKPFTIDEVKTLTGIATVVLDAWMVDGLLPLHTGDDRFTRGLNDSQLLGVYFGARYLQEGADLGRATEVMKHVVGTGINQIKTWSVKGRTMITAMMPNNDGTGPAMPIWVDAPLGTRLGRVLNSGQLLAEFEDKLTRMFK
jgi:hypothetical protein